MKLAFIHDDDDRRRQGCSEKFAQHTKEKKRSSSSLDTGNVSSSGYYFSELLLISIWQKLFYTKYSYVYIEWKCKRDMFIWLVNNNTLLLKLALQICVNKSVYG